MKTSFKCLLIGAEDEEKWLCDLKIPNISIKRTLYSDNELKKEYSYFEYDSRWPFLLGTENGKNICYELQYEEKVTNDILKSDNMCEEIFNKCNKIIKIINIYFGTIISLDFGNFYINDNFSTPYRKSILISYNPNILEDYSKMKITKEDIDWFSKNIINIMANLNDLIIDNYNTNLITSNMPIAFLNIMTCLEILFEEGKTEITYQISRGVAVLLSKDKSEGNMLFNQMKELYKLRSILIHSGKWDVTKYYKKYDGNEPFEDLKMILIKCIRKYLFINVSKEEFIEIIKSSGYGDIK